MPNTKSAKKALRQNKKRYLENKRVKMRIKRWVKKLQQLIDNSDVEKAEKTVVFIQKLLDKAGKKHIYHMNKINRLKSKYFKQVADLKKSQSEQTK